ncbi:MAG: type II toxin-antitoxin system HicB family antitoxin [bacterium]
MKNNNILSDYIESAVEYAEFELLDDNSFCGRIPICKGVIAFGKNLYETNKTLQSILEEWVLLGLRQGHELPVINGIDLNININQAHYESV